MNDSRKQSPPNKIGGNKSATIDAINMVTSNLYGVTPDFFKKHDKMIDDTKKFLSQRISMDRTSLARGHVDSGKSPVEELTRMIMSTVNPADRRDIARTVKGGGKFSQPSGSQLIEEQEFSTNNVDKLSDGTAIEELLSELQNHFGLMPEYSKIVDIIPELGKAVEMIIRDIVNRDEITQKFVTNFYKEEDQNKRTTIENKIKELLEEYDFEGKIRKWLYTAEVVGVKPFSILPQDDVVSIINSELAKRKNVGRSFESNDFVPTDIQDLFSEENFLLKSPLNLIYNVHEKISTETLDIKNADEVTRITAEVDSTLGGYVDKIITDDIVTSWEDICLDDLNEVCHDLKVGNASDPDKIAKISSTLESFNESTRDVKYRVNRNSTLKKHIRDFVVALDRSIEVVDVQKGALYQGMKSVKNNRYSSLGYSHESGEIEDFYKVSQGDKTKTTADPKKKTISINGFDIDISDNPIDQKEYAKSVKNRRAILTDYEPEHVIPISSGGTHIGYYVVEYLRTAGDNFMMLKKDKGSFADIIRRIGVGEDNALLKNTGTSSVDSGNPFSSGVFSPSTIMSPTSGGGGANVLSKYGKDGKNNKKYDLIKTILLKVITKRLGDENLINNATFQSSIMNLIRDDLIWKNNVRFTFIPESHMVYMSRELNGDGLPLSIFNGTLFTCYSYIASMISSLLMKVMKSSDVETMEVNMGKSKELGLTIGSISKNASTRNISAKTLFSGTDQIVRGVGNFKRLIIPVIDGEKLFDITQVEKANDITIDDEYTERLLKSVIMKIGVPPTSLDMMSQDEYVASMTQHRLDYRNLIVDRGVNYSKFITKAIRLLVKYSDISIPTLDIDKGGAIHDGANDKPKNDQNDIQIDIKSIDFKFIPPKALTVSKISEELNSIFELADNIVKMYYGEDAKSSPEWGVLILATKKYLVRHLSSSTDWTFIDKIVEEAHRETPKLYAQLEKYNIAPIPTPGANSDGGDTANQGDFGGGGGDGEEGGDGGFGGGSGEDDLTSGGEEGGSEGGTSEGGNAEGGTEEPI